MHTLSLYLSLKITPNILTNIDPVQLKRRKCTELGDDSNLPLIPHNYKTWNTKTRHNPNYTGALITFKRSEVVAANRFIDFNPSFFFFPFFALLGVNFLSLTFTSYWYSAHNSPDHTTKKHEFRIKLARLWDLTTCTSLFFKPTDSRLRTQPRPNKISSRTDGTPIT